MYIHIHTYKSTYFISPIPLHQSYIKLKWILGTFFEHILGIAFDLSPCHTKQAITFIVPRTKSMQNVGEIIWHAGLEIIVLQNFNPLMRP